MAQASMGQAPQLQFLLFVFLVQLSRLASMGLKALFGLVLEKRKWTSFF
jgi:hypothetical protein